MKSVRALYKCKDRDLLRLFVLLAKTRLAVSSAVWLYVTKIVTTPSFVAQTQRILKQYFGCEEEVEFTTYFSESPLARTHYIVRVDNNNMDVDVKTIEQNLMEVSVRGMTAYL
ncbi:NAD-glutamate dehydrogenase [Vibrio lentus]|nr:NAD-glutamate dehydrogenase [Vibrio lentus]